MGQRQFGQNDIGIPGIIPTGLISSTTTIQIPINTGFYNMYYGAGVWMPDFGLDYIQVPITTANINEFKTVYSYYGKGTLSHLGVSFTAAASAGRTGRIKVTLDGNVIYHTPVGLAFPTYWASNVSYYMYILHGWFVPSKIGNDIAYVGAYYVPTFDHLLFEKSLVVEYASNQVQAAGEVMVSLKNIKR